MATLTALSLLIGSAALAGAATLAKNMENAPPEPEPPQVPYVPPAPRSLPPQVPYVPPAPRSLPPQVPYVPPTPNPDGYRDPMGDEGSQYPQGMSAAWMKRDEAAAAAVPVPESQGATAPTVPAQAGDEMAGGAIGRPPWGKISSNVVLEVPGAPASTVPSATISSVLGIKENPAQLKNDLMTLERQIENTNFEVYDLNDKIARVNTLYTAERTKYIAELSKFKQAETTVNIYQKKLGNQGQQKSNKDPEVKAKQAEIDKAPAGSDERKRLQAEKDAMTQNKPASDAEIEAWTKKFSEATALQVAASDDKAEAERKKNKYSTQLTDLRTKQDEQEKLVKELIQKRAVLLGRLKTVLNENVKKEPPPADWEIRTARFSKADKARLDAERRLKQFYSDTWLPLQGQESQKQYKGQLDSLTALWKNAKAEFELARAALTAVPQDSITTAGADFRSFVVEVNDITRNATNSDGTIRDEWRWRRDNMRGYPQSVMTLKSYAVKPKIVAAADVYYEIAKMDSPSLVRNAPRFLNYFERILGSVTRAPESEQRPLNKLKLGREITKVVLKEFIQEVLGNAANDVRLYPDVVDDTDPQARAYADLREKTNVFVDAQIYFINKMFKNIKQARKDTKLSDVSGKNMIDLEAKARLIYPILDGVPPMGQCARIFKPSTLEMLRTGKRNGKDLTEVLEDPSLKDEFLKEIGFVKVSSFLEAQQFGKQPGINQADAIDLIKKAAFEEYTKNAERLAYEQPDGQSFVRVGGDWATLNAMNGIGPLTNQTLNELLSVPLGGNQLPNKIRAQQLRAEANLHPFVPGVFLESNRLPLGPVGLPRQNSLEPISEFRNACEIDGNVGSGKEEADRIIMFLDMLRDMEIEIKEKPNPLLTFIDKLTKANKVNARRADQAEVISVLSEKGFIAAFQNRSIIKVATQDRKLNFIQTFLTFRSSLFRSIPYNDTVVYNGKTMNTREVYSNLVFVEIEKMPSFDVRTQAEKDAFPSDEDWRRLSTDFNLNFTIYYDNNGVGATNFIANTRLGVSPFSVFKEKNGRYFPIRFEAGAVGAPTIPRGAPGGPVTTFNRGILGGAIDGIQIPILSESGADLKEAIAASKKGVTPFSLPTTKQLYSKFIQPWLSSDMSCITNRGKDTFYENVTDGIRQGKCVIKLDKLTLQLCKDNNSGLSNNLGRGGFKDAFCAVVEKDEKLEKGTKVALLYYRKSGELPDEPEVGKEDIVYTNNPHATKEEFINEIEPSLKRQEQAAKLNIAPQLYSYGFVKGVGGFAVVEFVDGNSLANIFKSNQLTEKYLLDLLKSFLKLGNINITQDDTNSSNFIWKDERFIFIDDLSPLYKPGRAPKDIAEHLSLSIHTLMMMIMSGTTDLEKDFDGFMYKILNYKFTDEASFIARYDADGTIVKNEFHDKIVNIVAKAIPNAIKFVPPPASAGLVPGPASASASTGLVPPLSSASASAGTSPSAAGTGLLPDPASASTGLVPPLPAPGTSAARSGMGSSASAAGTELLPDPASASTGLVPRPFSVLPETPETKAHLDKLFTEEQNKRTLVASITAFAPPKMRRDFLERRLNTELEGKGYDTVKLLQNWETFKPDIRTAMVSKLLYPSSVKQFFQNLNLQAGPSASASASKPVEQKGLKPGFSKRAKEALGIDSDDEGGRRRTRSSWRRSKPSRYTRRKF